MRYSGKTLMNLCAVAIAAWFVLTALKWPLRTAIFPIIIGVPVFFMALVELFFSFTQKEEITKKINEEDISLPEIEKEALPVGRTLWAFIFLIGLLLLICLFGFPIGVPLFVFLYLKIHGKESWGMSIGLTALAWGSLYGFFVRLLNTPFPEGWIQRLLGIV
jgi:hypothetical protein